MSATIGDAQNRKQNLTNAKNPPKPHTGLSSITVL